MSAGTSLVLQPRQPEERRSSDQHLQSAAFAFQSSMGEMFEGFCVKLRKELACDVAQTLGSLSWHQAVGPELADISLGMAEVRSIVQEIRAAVPDAAARSLPAREAPRAGVAAAAPWAGVEPPARVDLGPVLEEVGHLRTNVAAGFTELLRAARAPAPAAAQAAEPLREGRRREECRGPWTPSTSAGDPMDSSAASTSSQMAVAGTAPGSGTDLSPLLAEIRQLHASLREDFSAAVGSLKEGKPDAGLPSTPRSESDGRASPEVGQALQEIKQVLGGVWDCRNEVDRSVMSSLSAVLKTLTEGTIKVDRASLKEALQAVKEEVSDAAQEHEPSLKEVSRMVAEINQGQLKPDLSPIVKEFEHVQSQLEVGMCGIMKALEQIHVSVDCSEIRAAIEGAKVEVLQANASARSHVDLSAVLQAVQDAPSVARAVEAMKVEVLAAVREQSSGSDLVPAANGGAGSQGELGVDLPVLMSEVRQMQSRLDEGLSSISEIVKAVRDGTSALDRGLRELAGDLSEVRRGHLGVDLPAAVGEAKQAQAQVQAGLSEALEVLKVGILAMDSTAVLRQIAALEGQVVPTPDGARGPAPGEAELASAPGAIHESRSAPDISRLVQEIQADLRLVGQGKLGLDLPLAMKEVQQLQSELKTGVSSVLRILNEGSAVDVARRQPDVPLVLRAVDDSRPSGSAADPLILQDVQRMLAQVHAGLSTVLNLMREGSNASNAPTVVSAVDAVKAEVCWAIRELRTDVNLAPVAAAVGDLRAAASALVKARSGGEEAGEVGRRELGLALAPLLSEVQQMRSQLGAGLSAVHEAMRDAGLAADRRLVAAPSPECLKLEAPRPPHRVTSRPGSAGTGRRHGPPRGEPPLLEELMSRVEQVLPAEARGWRSLDPEPDEAYTTTGGACSTAYGQLDLRRRPASAPLGTWEAARSRDDPDEDPDLALAESMAVRGQYLADAAAEAQSRAEAICAAEAVLELPSEASVQSWGTEGLLPPIPEEPDPEASMLPHSKWQH